MISKLDYNNYFHINSEELELIIRSSYSYYKIICFKKVFITLANTSIPAMHIITYALLSSLLLILNNVSFTAIAKTIYIALILL